MPSDSKPLKASGSLVSSNWLEYSPLDQGTGQGKDPAVPGWSEKLRLNAALCLQLGKHAGDEEKGGSHRASKPFPSGCIDGLGMKSPIRGRSA